MGLRGIGELGFVDLGRLVQVVCGVSFMIEEDLIRDENQRTNPQMQKKQGR